MVIKGYVKGQGVPNEEVFYFQTLGFRPGFGVTVKYEDMSPPVFMCVVFGDALLDVVGLSYILAIGADEQVARAMAPPCVG